MAQRQRHVRARRRADRRGARRLDGDREVRQPDGYFGTPPQWANRNVSGVLLASQVMPYHVQRAVTTLWRHANPVHELPDAVGLPVDTLSLADGTLVEVPAPPRVDQLFGLSNPWPPGEAWPDDE